MEYTCFEGMPLPLPFPMDERSGTMNGNCAALAADSSLLLDSFHTQQQHFNPNYYYNHQQFNFPAVSWSTTDPTLLVTDPEPKQPEGLFHNRGGGGSLKLSCDSTGDDDMDIQGSCGGGLASFPNVQLHQSRSGADLHLHAGALNDGDVNADQIGLHLDTLMDGRSSRRGNTISSRSGASSIDPFSFCGAGGGSGSGGGVNATSQSQWMPQMCSLPSDEYHSCVDALMMPKLVSDPFSDSPQQQHPPCTYYMTSSTSVNCLHEADSCGSSDRDRSTTSEEINWMNSNNRGNNSDIIQQQRQGGGGCTALPNLRGCGGGGGSMTGLMLSSVELPDEYSSSIAAAADDVELLDPVRQQHHRSTSGGTTTAAAPPHSGRVSWMPPGTGDGVRKNNHGTTLDPLFLLGSGPAAACTSPTQQHHLQMMSNNGLLPAAKRSVLGPFKPQQQQHRAYTLDSLPTRLVPLSFSTPQNYIGSSMISPRYRFPYASVPPLINNAGMVDNCTTTSSGSFYKDFHSFSNRPQDQGVLASSSGEAAAAGGMGGFREFNVGVGGFESKRKFCSDQLPLLSASRKPNATSIEPQSVAARHRRKKISERVRVLEKLIPRGNKMDTASMLDEAIDYVKFLQLQVQLLESMGEPEPLNAQSNTTAVTTTSTSMTTPIGSNSNVDGNALIGGGFGSSHHLSRSAALMQKVSIGAASGATTTMPTTSPPLILSEVLQEQLFKQKLCLVSLRQYSPQQQARRSC